MIHLEKGCIVILSMVSGADPNRDVHLSIFMVLCRSMDLAIVDRTALFTNSGTLWCYWSNNNQYTDENIVNIMKNKHEATENS